ncbi:decaprenyl-phosphate phosphoribosyltransferase [Nocardioides guangzhouensis]|uniref:Decaprenyl-phosphate phosphoribosyltransferase n=1 Tax=Nocardioides guangzhouensis TaxID=2497878 RepID=A0A4Q4ZBL9_9ACTN|nr:decaprenyl-phosphate phosphoribosyltransferase [Nocardioides guangzhouensis]RYP84975.1 decaprenyl-phosphate phosphoribosyltransferase [Nocardioides guangzhouensis]
MTSPVVRAMRPRQWIKNLLVLAAPLAAGELFDPSVAGPTALAFAAFCLMSSAVYLVNDCADVESDRVHPRKRFRPIAAGELTVRTALVVAGVLVAASLALALVAGWSLAAILAGYFLMQVGYALWFKHEPVLDITVVTVGFLLRAVAGGVAADLAISQWFLLVAGFGSLFIVAGKRYSELHTIGSEAGTRRSLVRYTDTYLRFVWSVAAAATVMSYSLWAFENSGTTEVPWHTISILPFVVGLLRYAVDIDAGRAAEPEDIVVADRLLQAIGVCWLAPLCLGVLGV